MPPLLYIWVRTGNLVWMLYTLHSFKTLWKRFYEDVWLQYRPSCSQPALLLGSPRSKFTLENSSRMQLFCKVYFLLFGSLSRTLCVFQFFLHFKHLEPPIALAFCRSQVYMVELENREVDENNMSKAATSTQRHRSRHDDRLNGECQSLSGLSWVDGDNQQISQISCWCPPDMWTEIRCSTLNCNVCWVLRRRRERRTFCRRNTKRRGWLSRNTKCTGFTWNWIYPLNAVRRIDHVWHHVLISYWFIFSSCL